MSTPDPVFRDLSGSEREQIVLDLLDRMLSCDRLLVTCEWNTDPGESDRLSTINGDWSLERLRLAHRNAVKCLRWTLREQDARQAVEQLIGPEDGR